MTDTGPRLKMIPPGDTKERLVCPECQFVEYENPKVAPGTVTVYEDKILLARRAIEPRVGYWTLPAGFMENGETVQEGAARETFEETGARVEIGPLIGIFHGADKTRIMMIFRAAALGPEIDAGEESLEVKWFAWEDLPPDEELAFPMVRAALDAYQRTKGLDNFAPEISVLPRMTPPPQRGPKPPGP